MVFCRWIGVVVCDYHYLGKTKEVNDCGSKSAKEKGARNCLHCLS